MTAPTRDPIPIILGWPTVGGGAVWELRWEVPTRDPDPLLVDFKWKM